MENAEIYNTYLLLTQKGRTPPLGHVLQCGHHSIRLLRQPNADAHKVAEVLFCIVANHDTTPRQGILDPQRVPVQDLRSGGCVWTMQQPGSTPCTV